MRYKYIIGTGWWCTSKEVRDERFLNGDDEIRGSKFHDLWAKSISKYSNPSKIVVVDSSSPVVPEWRTDLLDMEVIRLSCNLGHATSLKNSKFCGWSASVILSMQFASLSDTDFYVYVEQDALIHGEEIIEKLITDMGPNVDFLFGQSDSNVQPLQQSFFIVRKSAIDGFLSNLQAIKYSDAQICPEVKFALASSPLSKFFPNFLFKQYPGTTVGKIVRRCVVLLCRLIAGYKCMKIGYGRSRPINFGDKYFYFQHGNKCENSEFQKLLNKSAQ